MIVVFDSNKWCWSINISIFFVDSEESSAYVAQHGIKLFLSDKLIGIVECSVPVSEMSEDLFVESSAHRRDGEYKGGDSESS